MSIGRRLGRIFEQARRRRVFRVVGVYAVAAWAVIEVSSTVFPLLELPEWGPRMIVVLALLGFPLAVVLAWMFDLTPGGVVRTVEGDAPAEAPPVSAQRAFAGRAAGFFGLGILVALVTFAAYARFGPVIGSGARTEAISSIAVLPFTDLSPTGDQAYFGDGMAEELLNRLAHVEGPGSRREPRRSRSRGRTRTSRASGGSSASSPSSKAASARRATACASPRSSSTPVPASTSGRRRTTGPRPPCSRSRTRSRTRS